MKECINAVKERRSIVAFEAGKNIPEETLKDILNVANMSPSSMNLQPWEVKAVISPEKKKILRACANNQPKVEEASATLIIIANPKAVEENIDKVLNNWIEIGNMQEQSKEIYKKMSLQLYTDDIMSKTRTVFAVKNTAFFAMSIMIAARFFGFETHPMDGINEAEI
jgi:nitroreductase